MELKKFEAPTLAQALQVVKRELGPEAIILATKNKRSAWGLMNQSSVEVTATVSEEALEKKRVAESNLSPDQRAILGRQSSSRVIQAYDVLSGKRLSDQMRSQDPAAQILAASLNRQPAAPKAQPAPARSLTQRRYIDIGDDENAAEQMTHRSQDRTHISSNGSSIRQSTVQKVSTGILSKLIAQMIEVGIDEELVRDIGDELKMLMLREHVTHEETLRLQLARIIMTRMRVARPLSERLRIPNTPRVISFVGPTGVGKTTTVAKIAAELVINQKRPVTLATTDTYKIAAIEQLQTYANILRIPIEVCPTPEALAHLTAQLGPNDVVLVDTAGYGPKDEKKLYELKDTLTGVRTETHLCVAATTRDRDLAQIVKRFQMFELDYLVTTKLDETSIYGNLYNISVRSHLPLSYLTMGQRVPEDIEVATKERVADLLLNIAGGE